MVFNAAGATFNNVTFVTAPVKRKPKLCLSLSKQRKMKKEEVQDRWVCTQCLYLGNLVQCFFSIIFWIFCSFLPEHFSLKRCNLFTRLLVTFFLMFCSFLSSGLVMFPTFFLFLSWMLIGGWSYHFLLDFQCVQLIFFMVLLSGWSSVFSSFSSYCKFVLINYFWSLLVAPKRCNLFTYLLFIKVILFTYLTFYREINSPFYSCLWMWVFY